MLPKLQHDYHVCSYPSNIEKCIKASENIQYLLQGLILCPVVTAPQTQDFYECSEPIFGKLTADISIQSLSIACHYRNTSLLIGRAWSFARLLVWRSKSILLTSWGVSHYNYKNFQFNMCPTNHTGLKTCRQVLG